MPRTEVRVFQIDDENCPFLEWLGELKNVEPKARTKCLFLLLALQSHGHELRRPMSDSLRDGIRELRAEIKNSNWRILYSFIGPHIALISHGITKEAEVPDREIDLALLRVNAAKSRPDKHTASLDLKKLQK